MGRRLSRPGAVPRPSRNVMPVQLPGAARFSDEDAAFFDPVTLVTMINTAGELEPVREALAEAIVDFNHGPDRAPGNWPLMMLAYAGSGIANVQPWYRRASANPALWFAAGFKSVPAYQTVWQRFAELEQFPQAFSRAASHLIDIARRHDPRIGMHVSVDGTESQTHAQPVHACGPNDDCPTRGSARQPRLPRVGVEEATALRQYEARIEEHDDEPEEPKRAPTPGLDPVPEDLVEITPDGLLFTDCGHYWLSRDTTAGTRKYKTGKDGKGRGKVFFGFISNKAVDTATGGVLAVLCTHAGVNESVSFPVLYEALRDAVGCDPLAIITDRGLVTDGTAQFCTERGVTQVAPFRKRHATHPARPPATDRVDEDGIPRCRHCGLSGDFVRFSEVGTPRIWFRCPLPTTDGCRNVQSIVCTEDIRRLLPIGRTSPIYGALYGQMGVREHAHGDFRTYFRCGGKSLPDRQRRIGVYCQQLRANAAIVVQWFWILTRQGWLGSRPERAELVEVDPGRYHRRIIASRVQAGMLGGGYPAPRGVQAGSDPPAPVTAAA